jgi:hypothetical protein
MSIARSDEILDIFLPRASLHRFSKEHVVKLLLNGDSHHYTGIVRRTSTSSVQWRAPSFIRRTTCVHTKFNFPTLHRHYDPKHNNKEYPRTIDLATKNVS